MWSSKRFNDTYLLTFSVEKLYNFLKLAKILQFFIKPATIYLLFISQHTLLVVEAPHSSTALENISKKTP